jgi:hypothetical protein
VAAWRDVVLIFGSVIGDSAVADGFFVVEAVALCGSSLVMDSLGEHGLSLTPKTPTGEFGAFLDGHI